MFHELIKKVNAIGASKRLNKTDCNTKIRGTGEKIPSVTNLAAIAAASVVQNKILDVSDLVEK